MGRLESLTALALGRGPYEDHVVEWSGDENREHNGQLYNEHGHPKNPETRRREREHVRAANEVMQVTGIVEDSTLAKIQALRSLEEKSDETLRGLRWMEIGRAVMVCGVWGVLGLRRRILLYRSYAETGLLQILKQETKEYGLGHVLTAGLPTVLAYHAADWAAFYSERLLDDIFGEDEEKMTPRSRWWKESLQKTFDVGFFWVTLHFRMFAVLQQLYLIPGSRRLPSLLSFVPFSSESPLLSPLPALASASATSMLTVLESALPLFYIVLHGKVKFFASHLLYRPIYKLLPRPKGASMFAGLPVQPPTMEYDTPDQPLINANRVTEDEITLRALEGLPSLGGPETRARPVERDSDSSADDAEMTHATLISFDVEATDNAGQGPPIGGGLGQWSAELRSANELPPSETRYRMTGVTLLPTIMAVEGLREILAGIAVLPLEAVMVRCIGRLYRASANAGVADMWPRKSGYGGLVGFTNILSALTLQLGVTGAVWAGFTVASQWAARRKRVEVEKEKEAETQALFEIEPLRDQGANS